MPKTVEELESELATAKTRITELNSESAEHRRNAKTASEALDAAKANHTDETKAFGEKLSVAEKNVKDAGDRVTNALRDAALRIAAKDAGMIDSDALKLLDTSAVTVAEDGAVSIPKDFFTQAKEAKPYLFTQTGADAGTTASLAKTPPKETGKPKQATAMSDEEYAALKAEVTGRTSSWA